MSSEREFHRSLGLLDATMIVMGSMIGSGIFIVSAEISRNVGSPVLLLLVWMVTGLLTLTAALSYGELAGMMPKAGGQYVYLREAYSKPVAFLYGWSLFTVIQTGTIAAVAVAFGKFSAYWFPTFSEKNAWLTLNGFAVGDLKVPAFSISGAQVLAIASIVVLTLINLRGVTTGKTVQTFFTIIKVLALAALIAAGLYAITQHNFFARNFSMPLESFRTELHKDGTIEVEKLVGLSVIAWFAVSMVGSLFSSDAWNNITFIAGEVKNPEKNIPRALFFGTVGVTIIYILANTVFLGVLPLTGTPDGAGVEMKGIQFAESDRVGVASSQMIFGNYGSYIIASLIMLSTFACNNGLILSGARVYYTMAQDGLFFKQASVLNKNGVPAKALILQGIWASLLCLSGTYGNLLDYVVFCVLIFYVLTIYGVIRLRKTQPAATRPYKAIGYPFMQYLYIVLALIICIFLLVYKPSYTWPGLLIVSLGIPVYMMTSLKKKGSKEA